MRPEVQVLPGPPVSEYVAASAAGKVAGVKKRLLLVLAIVGASAAALKRRRGRNDAALWREATSDSSR
jgi:hypothetical protein